MVVWTVFLKLCIMVSLWWGSPSLETIMILWPGYRQKAWEYCWNGRQLLKENCMMRWWKLSIIPATVRGPRSFQKSTRISLVTLSIGLSTGSITFFVTMEPITSVPRSIRSLSVSIFYWILPLCFCSVLPCFTSSCPGWQNLSTGKSKVCGLEISIAQLMDITITESSMASTKETATLNTKRRWNEPTAHGIITNLFSHWIFIAII